MPSRQAADAVRSRIDWKYALGLELTDPGFDFTVLSEFRARLVAGGAERLYVGGDARSPARLAGWSRPAPGSAPDSTHVLAAIRTLNRLELVGKKLRLH